MSAPKGGERLTGVQERAVRAGDRDLWLTAGAGSGKTRVLTERYLHLHLARSIPLQQILAVTFTEKAAGEMRGRIARRLREAGRRDSLRDLPHAPIGTIDSFCLSLAREYADRGGIDPSLRVLDPVEAAEWEEEVWADVLDTWWAKRRRDSILLLGALPWNTGLRHVGGIDPAPLLSLVRRIRTAGVDPRSVSFEVDGEALVSRIWEEAPPLLTRVRRLIDAGQTKKTTEKLEQLLRLGEGASLSGEEKARLAGRVREAVSLRVGAAARETVREGIALLDRLRLAGNEIALGRARAFLGELLLDFHRRFSSRKERAAAADFLDIEEIAARLLADRDVRRDVRGRRRYLLLDECQDTNALQLDIVRRLRSPGRFLAVGDAKQSIYRFRDADVTAFVEMGRSLGPTADRLDLSENFRSRGAILDWVNRFFPLIWKENDGMGVPFEPLESARDDFPAKAEPSVEFLRVIGNGGAGGAREEEAALLAERLAALDREGIDDLGYGDMAILFRSAAGMAVFERALRERGIPAVVAVGRGFFQSREVADLLTGLRLVDDCRSDIDVAAALRSPLASVGDDDIARLLLERGEEPLIARLGKREALSSLTDEGAARAGRFGRLLRQLRELRGLLPAGRLLEMLAAETGFLDSLLTSRGGRRRYANSVKLIEIARDIDRRGDLSLPETIAALQRYRVTRLREPESATDEERFAVRLMTIHGAKGMQFPLVAVADIGRRSAPSRRPFLFRRGEVVGIRGRHAETYTYRELLEREKDEEKAEEARLFYVAVTRAERHLIVSGSRTGRSAAWLDLLEKSGVPFDTPGGGIHCGVPVNIIDPSAAAPRRTGRRLTLSRFLADTSRRAAKADGPKVEKIIRRLTAVLPAASPAAGRTVTAVDLFRRCAEKYRLSRLFLPPGEMGEVSPEEGGGRESGLGGAEEGTLFHSAMEAAMRRRASGPPAEESPALSPKIAAWRDAVLALPAMKKILAGADVDAERSFAVIIEGALLRGKVDLLARSADGWHVIDYKTDRAAPEEIAARHATALALYRLALSRLAGERIAVRASIVAVRARLLLPVPEEADLEALDSLRRFDRAVRAERFDPPPAPPCASCEYRFACRKRRSNGR